MNWYVARPMNQTHLPWFAIRRFKPSQQHEVTATAFPLRFAGGAD